MFNWLIIGWLIDYGTYLRQVVRLINDNNYDIYSRCRLYFCQNRIEHMRISVSDNTSMITVRYLWYCRHILLHCWFHVLVNIHLNTCWSYLFVMCYHCEYMYDLGVIWWWTSFFPGNDVASCGKRRRAVSWLLTSITTSYISCGSLNNGGLLDYSSRVVKFLDKGHVSENSKINE